MGKTVREFATHWDGNDHLWFERDEDDLVGTHKSGACPLPRVRICDLTADPTNRPGFRPPVLWSGRDGVIEVHHTNGPEEFFRRPANFDILIFQFAGSSAIESEYGEFVLKPAHVIHIPAGSAYRVIGNPQCYQLVAKTPEPFEVTVDPEKPLTETVFDVQPKGSNESPEEISFPSRDGTILEVTEFWNNDSQPITIERTHAKLVNCATAKSDRKVTVLRAFDYFCGSTGKGVAAPELFRGKNFKCDVYNTQGQQNGFHRGCDGEEIWFQFRGHGLNETEWGAHELDPGEIGYVPRGLAHRITGDEEFLRFNLYFHGLMVPRVDASSHHGETPYEVKTVSRTELLAYNEAEKRIEEDRARGVRPTMA